MSDQVLTGRLLAKAKGLSRRGRVLTATGFFLAASLAPSFAATPASARELYGDSLSDPASVVAPTPARVDPSSRGGIRGSTQSSIAVSPTTTAARPLSTTPNAAPVAPAATSTVRTALPDISTPDKFIAAVAPAAQDSQKATGVPASVTIAQAILESEWGRSGLSKKAQNYFGIKALDGPGPAGTISMDTWEVFGGKDTVIEDAFKAYHNLYESVIDHGDFLRENPRYADAFKTNDPKKFAQRIHQAGYATDPNYCGKLGNLIDKYGLSKFDLKSGDKS